MTAPADTDVGDFDFDFIESPEETETPDVTSEVDTEFAEQAQETARARQYRKKVSRGLGHFWRPLLAQPETINDATAILQYGPDFARAVGRLADEDAKARKVIDFVTEGVDNAYLNCLAFGIPLVAQLMRNHEDNLKTTVREVKLPFTKLSFKIKLGLSLGRFRNMTSEPTALTQHVLSNQKLLEALRKQGIVVGWTDSDVSANGTGKKSGRFRSRSPG